MSFRWFNSYVPRSLHLRVALIMLLPVITLFLVVSVVFVQRHFQGVTAQMTLSVSREVKAVLSFNSDPADESAYEALSEMLKIDVTRVDVESVPDDHVRRWYDLTGRIVIREFKHLFPGILAVELPDDKNVALFFMYNGETLKLSLDRRRVSASNPAQLLINMLFFGVVMTSIAYVYMRNQLRPITLLAHAAEAFGRGRHMAYRPGGATEVRAAGSAFLDMRARIERQIEQRTLMLSGVSHDLRTPLTRLKLGLSLLEDEESEAMLRDVADMERLLDEFLTFARGAQEGEPEPVNPIELVRHIVDDCQRANIPAALMMEKGEGEVLMRPVAMRRAIENLINNAVRYGSRAELSVHLSEKTLRIRVEDDGPGIPADQRDEALKPFARLVPARNQNKGTGVGLGLAITTDIVRAHGGTLRLGESPGLGGLQADIVIAR